ncbi:MAG: phosphate signaling complex protein PhoU [Armatimonadetes bacterium]|nr:phosphate signaling complex protein PhoU [Armatimonadota bacterium]
MNELEQQLLEMVSLADVLVEKAVDSLASMNVDLAYEVMSSDDAIDDIDLDIEHRCLRLLALQQPMGSDLREIGTVLKIITDIERIGDLSVDIAKITLKINQELGTVDYIDIPRMATIARQMLRESVQSLMMRDVESVPSIVKLEDEVDKLYRDLRDQIHAYMRTHPEQVVAASWLILAVHHVERIADHALNIAERVGFMVTGELKQLGSDMPTDESEGT